MVIWGFKMEDSDKEDPVVYQGQENEQREWYSEEMSFSKFIIDA